MHKTIIAKLLKQRTKKLVFDSVLFVSISLSILTLPATPVLAHGFGTSQRAESGEFLLEFEYEALEQLPAQESIYYTVRLLNKASGAEAEYDSVFVRITTDQNKIVLSTNLVEAPDTIGASRFLFAVPTAGNYTAEVLFAKEGKQLAQGDFNYTAISLDGEQPATDTKFVMQDRHWALLGIALIVGLIIGLLFKSKKTS